MEKDREIRGHAANDIIVDEVQTGFVVPIEYNAVANKEFVSSELFVSATADLEVETLAELDVPDPEDINEAGYSKKVPNEKTS